MKKILITATAAVFGFASVYLFCAFVKLSFDVGAWETYERLCMGVIAIAVAAGCALLAGESYMTKREKAHLDRVASLGCVVCRNQGYGATPAQIHHIRAGQGMSQRASNYLVIPLCPSHHTDGGKGVAIHAGQQAFEAIYGSEMDLLAQTIGDAHELRATM